MSKISYSAVVLDEQSANELKQAFLGKVPNGWEWVGHHMTIKMGELPPEMKQYLGQEVDLVIDSLGIDDRAMAVGIGNGGELSTNKIPHVTLAVNRSGGGKPFHSNKIPVDNWEKLDNRFTLTGYVEEIPQK